MKRAGLVGVLGILALGAACRATMSQPIADLERSSGYIFEGTVEKTRASNVGSLPATDSTLVVRVESVLRAPKALGDLTGKRVTIIARDAHGLPLRQRAVFFAGAHIVGASVALIEVGHVIGVDRETVRRLLDAAVQQRSDDELRSRLRLAVLVVVGQVTRSSPLSRTRTFRGEHDPQWWEAKVAIESIEKNSWSADTVAVVYPGSRDVMWYQVEKFEPPKDGIWLLHRNHIESRTDSVLTAVDRLDFHPRSELDRIRRLLRSLR